MLLNNDCFGEYLTAINGDLYGENVGALPGDFIILLCLCHGDLNGEQSFMVSYCFSFSSVQTELALPLNRLLTPETKFKYTFNPYSLT